MVAGNMHKTLGKLFQHGKGRDVVALFKAVTRWFIGCDHGLRNLLKTVVLVSGSSIEFMIETIFMVN